MENLQRCICEIVCKIENVKVLEKILTYVNRMVLK